LKTAGQSRRAQTKKLPSAINAAAGSSFIEAGVFPARWENKRFEPLLVYRTSALAMISEFAMQIS
jgi:hypothetical protein